MEKNSPISGTDNVDAIPSPSIQALSREEREELVRLIQRDLAIVLNRPPKTSTIDPQHDTPLDAYIATAQYNVYIRNREKQVKQ